MYKSNKIISLLLSLVVLFSLTGCSQTNDVNEKIPYSIGLTDDGFYENIEKYEIEIPDFTLVQIQADDILKNAIHMLAISSESDSEITVDDYIIMYGNSFLKNIGLGTKTEAEEGDLVYVNLSFFGNDGTEWEDYKTENNSYLASAEGDSITSSFIGHQINDIYEVQYTFPEDASDHPNEVATVKVTINSIEYSDPLNAGVLEENLEAINLYFSNVTDIESYKKALKPYLVEYHLGDYLENYITSLNMDVPEEFVDIECQRLKSRLQSLGYNYSDYEKDSKLTPEEIRDTCRQAARENMLAMKYCKNLNISLTKDDMYAQYGESNYDYYVNLQGEPYMKLRIMRQTFLDAVAKQVSVLDGNVPVDLNNLVDLVNENE